MNYPNTPPPMRVPFGITDDRNEMESLGRQIVDAAPEVYTDRVIGAIKGHIDKMMPQSSAQEKESIYFRTVYDYWAYGDTIVEEFLYKFFDKSHAEKSEYLVMRPRTLWCDRVNNKRDAINLLENKYGAYKFLRTYYRRDAFLLHDENDYNDFCAFVSKHPSFIVKPVNLANGLYVSKDSVDNYASRRELFDKLLRERTRMPGDTSRVTLLRISGAIDVILEEVIDQAPEIAAFHPASVNSLRIFTFKSGDEVKVFYPCLKIGAHGHVVDNAVAGGLFAGINVFTGQVETDFFDDLRHLTEPTARHPDTGMKIRGFQMPRWNEVVSLVKELAKKFDRISYIGWDMALTPDGWCVVESNGYGDLVFYQVAYGRGIRKEFEELVGCKLDRQFWWQK